MKRSGTARQVTNYVSGCLFAIFLFLCSSVSYAQSPTNFSGVWLQDTLKSDPFYKSFEVKYTISQNPQAFNVKQAFTLRGGNETVTEDYSFTLDGNVTSMKKESGTEKELARWSADKKILTTRSTTTYGNEEVGFTETYTLSDNGLVLTVQKANIIPGVPAVKLVFNKKL